MLLPGSRQGNKGRADADFGLMRMSVMYRMNCEDRCTGKGEKNGTTVISNDRFRDSLFLKLDIHNRVGLVLFAIQTGIVTVEINQSGRQEEVH
jgi:hypothetical protein